MGVLFKRHFLVCFFYPWIVSNVNSNPEGIIPDAAICTDMRPGPCHKSGIEVENPTVEYQKDLCYSLGSPVNVTISFGNKISGIMIQAKAPGDMKTNYGSFKVEDTENFKSSHCFTKLNSTMFQKKPLDRSNVTFYWDPKETDNVGDLAFYISVVFTATSYGSLTIPLPLCSNNTKEVEISTTTTPTTFNPATTLETIESTVTIPTTAIITTEATTATAPTTFNPATTLVQIDSTLTIPASTTVITTTTTAAAATTTAIAVAVTAPTIFNPATPFKLETIESNQIIPEARTKITGTTTAAATALTAPTIFNSVLEPIESNLTISTTTTITTTNKMRSTEELTTESKNYSLPSLNLQNSGAKAKHPYTAVSLSPTLLMLSISLLY